MRNDINKPNPKEIKPGEKINHGLRSAPKTQRPPKPPSQNKNG
ncbi:hypothetical protein [Bacillus subtilis]|nr:hypothetical protein [Bacillus subtilis]